MNTYTSQIAARFNGPSTEGHNTDRTEIRTIVPNAPFFGNLDGWNNDHDDFPFFSPSLDIESDLPLHHPIQGLEGRTMDIKSWPPLPDTHSFERIHKLLHADFFSGKKTKEQLRHQAGAKESRVTPKRGLDSGEFNEFTYKDAHSQHQETLTGSHDKQGILESPLAKQDKITFLSTAPHSENKKVELTPLRRAKHNAKTPPHFSESSRRKEDHESTLSKEMAVQTMGQGQINSNTPPHNIRPIATRMAKEINTSLKKHKENRITIGNINIEIIPSKPPRRKTVPPETVHRAESRKPSPPVNKTRFPQRFGLGQI